MSNQRRGRSIGIVAVTAAAMCLFSSAGLARPVAPFLFLTGDGFTLEGAMSEATSQRTPQDPQTYKLLVMGSEIRRITVSGASASVRELLHTSMQGGASVYVCAKNLQEFGFKPADLLPGVHSVRGNQSAAVDWEKTLPQAPDPKMRAICSSN